jgi:hypothetical protein
MQYIQLQQQPEGDIPNASASGSMNLFVNNGCITLKDNTGLVLPQCGGGGSALDSLQMELGWGSGSTIGVNGERVRLLDLNTNINDILTGTTGDEVWLFIERYKGKRKKHDILGNNIIDEAQWKHDVYPDVSFPDRPSEIQLTAAKTMDFYFGQEQYFTINYTDPNDHSLGGTIISKGLGKGHSNTGSYVYLRFKLKIGNDLNGWSYSKPLAKIKLMWEFQVGGAGWLPQLNYKYV